MSPQPSGPTPRSVVRLEHVMAQGWRAVESERLGDWVLRASSGFTNRGNSVLAVGSPGCAPPEALEIVTTWYAARGLSAMLCLPTDPAWVPYDGPLSEHLGELGYRPAYPVLAMTALADALPTPSGRPPVRVDADLTPEWFAAFCTYRTVLPGVAERLLTGSPAQRFLSVDAPVGSVSSPAPLGDRPVAIARASLHTAWAGIQAMWVDPTHRRRGLARELVATVGRLAIQAGADRVYLEVERDNAVARACYEAAGLSGEHGHVYYLAPGPSAAGQGG
jgi:GNAT superfamily N-acetyltransferase